MEKKFKWWDNAVLYLIIAFALVFIGQLVGLMVTELPMVFYAGIVSGREGISLNEVINRIPGAFRTGAMYFEFIGIWAVTLAFFLIPSERPMFKAIWTKVKGNNIKNLLLGLLIGGGSNALCVLMAYLNDDIKLYFDSFQLIPLILVFLCVFVQSSAEELVCRGYLLQKLFRRHKNPWIGIIGNAVLFSLLHIFNDGVTPLALASIIVIGVQYSLMVYYMDSIWCPFAAHTAWNFTQNIIFGLPNSGMVVPFSIMKLDASTARDSWAYNVGFGVESTIFAVASQILVCIIIVIWGEKKKKRNTNIWEKEVVVVSQPAEAVQQ